MKIKHLFPPDIRQVMRKVEEELGEDAVILSNCRVNSRVEIISARESSSMLFHSPNRKLHPQRYPAQTQMTKQISVLKGIRDRIMLLDNGLTGTQLGEAWS